MFFQIALLAMFFALALAGSPVAQPDHRDNAQIRSVIEPPKQVQEVSGFGLSRDALKPAATDRRPADGALLAIATWLSENFDLPRTDNLPQIELVSPLRLQGLRYRGLLPDQWQANGAGQQPRPEFQREVVAVYDDSKRTIFLPESWTGATLGDQSVLVHEMVHHMQNLANLKYECVGAREKLAYIAQNEWLKARGSELEKEFEIDMFTIVVLSACMN